MSKSPTNQFKQIIPDVENFTQDETWRIFRISSEFVDSFETMSAYRNLVTVFGSARTKKDSPVYQNCVRMGELLVQHGYGVISGGGPGIMEASNRGAIQEDGVSIGLNIKLPMEQHSNPYQTESLYFRYFCIRKVCFLKYSTAAVAYPGGFGTLDELSEALTMVQTRKVNRIPIALVGKKFWTPLLDWFRDTLLAEGMISQEDLDLYKVVDSADEAMEYIRVWHAKYGIPSTVKNQV